MTNSFILGVLLIKISIYIRFRSFRQDFHPALSWPRPFGNCSALSVSRTSLPSQSPSLLQVPFGQGLFLLTVRISPPHEHCLYSFPLVAAYVFGFHVAFISSVIRSISHQLQTVSCSSITKSESFFLQK